LADLGAELAGRDSSPFGIVKRFHFISIINRDSSDFSNINAGTKNSFHDDDKNPMIIEYGFGIRTRKPLFTRSAFVYNDFFFAAKVLYYGF